MADKIDQIHEIVGRLDERTTAIREDVLEIKRDYGPRLLRVEGRQHWILGVGAGVGVAITGAWQWFFKGGA